MAAPFFIVGPTAVGKTAIAVEVAERCGAEVVNADAFQVYAGLDLLTAKPSAHERRRVPHHLIGTMPLSESYSVARYLQDAQLCLDDIAQRQRPAIVVGGSGMYVKALTHGLSPLPPAQPALRAELEELEPTVLLRRLQALDPVTASSIDRANKRRLIRAVEVCLVTGQQFSNFRDCWHSRNSALEPLGVLLQRDKAEMVVRIKHRVELMFSRGLIEEVRAVPTESVAQTAARMIGWEQVRAYLDGRITLQDCAEKIETATRQYAKRQITWFKRESVFEVVNLTGDGEDSRVVNLICERIARRQAPRSEGGCDHPGG